MTNMLCGEKKAESDLRLLRMETEEATHKCKLLSKNTLILGYQCFFYVNFCRIKVCPKMWTYFTL